MLRGAKMACASVESGYVSRATEIAEAFSRGASQGESRDGGVEEVPVATWAEALDLLGLTGASEARYLIVPLLHSGLARRLQLLAAAHVAAQLSGRVLVAAWSASPHCPAPLHALFTPYSLQQANIHTYTGPASVLVPLLPLYVSGEEGGGVDMARLMLGNRSYGPLLGPAVVRVTHAVLPSDALTGLGRHDLPVLLLDPTSGAFFKLQEMACGAFYALVSSVLRSLQPLAHVEQRVQGALQRLLGPQGQEVGPVVVGVHVRVDDAAYDSPLVPDLVQGGREYLGWNESAPMQDYASALRFIAQQHHQQYQGQRPLRFYVASNKPHVRDQLVHLVGQAEGGVEVLTWRDLKEEPEGGRGGVSYDRGDEAGVVHALEEMLVLAGCHGVVHAWGSAYGKVAAYTTMAPSLLLFRQMLLLGPTKGGQWCNTLEFMAYRAATGPGSHYQLGLSAEGGEWEEEQGTREGRSFWLGKDKGAQPSTELLVWTLQEEWQQEKQG